MNWSRLLAFPLHVGIYLAIVTVAAACAPSNPSSAPAATASARSSPVAAGGNGGANSAPAPTITMTNALRFEPATLSIQKGTTVTWRNTTGTIHTVTDDLGKAANKADAALPSGAQPWDSGNINPGETFQHTFDTPGTYEYFCTPHEAAGMVGTITVTG